MPLRLESSQPSTGEVTLSVDLCPLGGSPRVWSPPRLYQAPVSTKGRGISDQNRSRPPGTLASPQGQAAGARALLLLSALPLQAVHVPGGLLFLFAPFSLPLMKVRPSEQEGGKLSVPVPSQGAKDSLLGCTCYLLRSLSSS